MKIHYHLIGLGYIGKIHLMAMNNFHMVDMPLTSQFRRQQLVTRHPDNVKDSMGFSHIVAPDQTIYDEGKVHLMDICNPNVYHHDLLLDALGRNIHIYCEKPLTMNKEETKHVLESYTNSKSKVQLCYTMRYLPAFAKMRAAISNSAIGEVTSFRIEYYHSSYLNPDKPYAWRLDKNMSGGGALFDLGSHAIDLLQFLINPVEEVMAYTNTVVKSRQDSAGESQPVTVDDWSLVHLLTKNRVRGTIEVSRIAVGDEGIRVRIYGTKGSMMVNVFHNPIEVIYHNQLGQQAYLDDDYYINDAYYQHVMTFYPTPKMSQGFFMDSHMASLASFIYQIEEDHIIEGAPNLEACGRIEAILSACLESIATGVVQKVDI